VVGHGTDASVFGVIELSDWARDILQRSHAAAVRFNPKAKIRLAGDGGSVQAGLTEDPPPDDQQIVVGDFTLYAQAGLEGLVDIVEPHDQVVLRPPGSTPNEKPADH